MPSLELATATPDYWIGTFDSVLVVSFVQAVTEDSLRATADAFEAQRARYGGAEAIIIAEPGVKLPGMELREAGIALRNATASSTRANAIAILGEGFAHSAIRAVVTGIQMLSRARFPEGVFRDLESAVRFIMKQRKDAPPRGEEIDAFLAALARVREEHARSATRATA